MAIGWFLVPYTVEVNLTFPRYRRRPIFRAIIHTAGGQWAGSECLGNHLVAKIKAPEVTLQQISELDGVVRMPKNLLTASLSDLSNAQKLKIRDKLIDLGFPLAEIKERFGANVSLENYTLADVLRFACRRRYTPRVNDSGEFVLDGAERPTKSIDVTDAEVTD